MFYKTPRLIEERHEYLDEKFNQVMSRMKPYHYICVPSFGEVNARTRLILKCLKHGTSRSNTLDQIRATASDDFTCRECLMESTRPQRLLALVEKCKERHQDVYDYSKVQETFMDGASKVRLKCKYHGEFVSVLSQTALKETCPACQSLKVINGLQQAFKDRANLVHNGRYDYSKVSYVKATEKVEIICKFHGSFWQTPMSHVSGSGCKYCAAEKQTYSFVERYTSDKEQGSAPGLLYILKMWNDQEEFLKVGITSNWKRRRRGYNSSPYSYEMIKSWELTNLATALVEDAVLYTKKRNGMHYTPTKGFDGRYECVKKESFEELVSLIESEISKVSKIGT